jgi:microcystin degradation protein MlrC
MKLFVAGLMHETNSFSPIPTTRESFASTCLVRPAKLAAGDPAFAQLETYPAYGEILRQAIRRGDTVVQGLAAFAMPSAPASAALYAELKAAILEDLAAAMPVDAVLLMLHGAQLAEGCDDCAGDLTAAIRALAGLHVSIGVELDLHGYASDRLLAASDICLACKEYPHDDFDARAVQLYDLVARHVAGEISPLQVRMKAPMLAMHHPTRQPMRGLVDRTNAMEQGSVLAVSLLHGFPWADTPEAGASVVVVCDGDAAGAHSLAEELAAAFFAQRNEVKGRLTPLADALATRADRPGPIVLADGADNPGGGCASDSTFLMHALRDKGTRRAGIAILWDPDAVSAAQAAGVGATYQGAIGGRHGSFSGPPFNGRIRVLALADDVCQGGFFERAGDALGAAALQIDGLVMIVSGRRQQCVSPEAFTQFGIDPAALDLIVVKSSQHFHAGFASIAGAIVYCDAPGALSQDFAGFPYRRIPRPIWPLDDIDTIAS